MRASEWRGLALRLGMWGMIGCWGEGKKRL